MCAKGEFTDCDVVSSLAVEYADAVTKCMDAKWKHVAVMSYEDDSEFGYYMEQEFMSHVASKGEEHGYAVLIRNEH